MAAGDAETSLRVRKRRRTQDAIIDAALRLFEAKDYDAVSVEEIAAAADVSPRTFYRYFPAKDDVLLGGPHTEEATRRELAQRRPGETDIELVARAMLAGVTANDPARTMRVYRLIQTVPALQARLFQLVWRGGQEHFVDALLTGSPRTRDAELRARVLTHAVTDAMRVAVASWLQSGQPGPLNQECEKALTYLREAFTSASP
ncbi:MAG: TetR family transcriptional regulator [Pseudonocardiaceae bacterium]